MINNAWPLRPLGELFDIGAGKTMSAAAREGSEKTPFLRTSNVLWDEIDLNTVDEMAIPAHELQDKLLRPGDLLVCEGGEIGRAAIWSGQIEIMSFQNHLHRLRSLVDDVDPRFYVYFLQSAFTQLGIFEGAGNKTTIPNLSRNRLAALDVPYPDLAEQNDIVRALACVRQAMTLHDRSANLAQELKRAAMQALFARGLRGQAQKETEFGLVPETWEDTPLDGCATVQTGVAKGRKFSTAEMVDVPYLRVANVQDGHLDLAKMKEIRIRKSEIERYRLQPGDVVLTEGGDFDKLGRGFIWRGELDLCVHQNHVFAVRPHRDRLLPEFFAYLAQSAYGKAYFLKVAHKTTNLACINSTKLKAFPVPVPPTLDEQGEIVAVLDAIDRKIDLHRRKRAVLDELFKALLHKLMTGKISVANLNLSALVASKPVAAVAA
ncbi:type I restriction enzyme, S subunit [Rhodospirillales bacterium URHD0017]|nr:type I restriction enzyme, S subunit [Rhodospirillales bacterium URHD0017]